MTGVPPDHQKLIYSGAVLKDDLATLATYDLIDAPPASSSSSTTSFWDNWSFTGNNKTRKLKRLVMLGDKDVARVLDRKIPIEEPPPEKVADDEVTLVKKIGDIVENSVREWEPKILQLESYLAERRSGAEVETDSAPVEAPNPRTAIWLSEGELVLQVTSHSLAMLLIIHRFSNFASPSAIFTQARFIRYSQRIFRRAQGAKSGC